MSRIRDNETIRKRGVEMTNVDKLKGAIVEHRLTVEAVANKIGIDKTTMYRKMANNGEDFTIKQADAISNLLSLSGKEAQAIFFSQFVADMR